MLALAGLGYLQLGDEIPTPDVEGIALPTLLLGGGVLAGLVLAVAVDRAMGGGPLSHGGFVLIPSVAGLMLAIGLAAAVAPARRGLAVQPTEALREE